MVYAKILKGNIFDFGMKTAANKMRTTQEKILPYVEMNYGMDITNKLRNRKKFIVLPAVYSDAIMARHAVRETIVQAKQSNLLSQLDLELPMELAKINNEIATIGFELVQSVKVQVIEQEKTEN